LWEKCKTIILWLKRWRVLWNQQIEECGLMLHARQPQKTKTKCIGRCNKDLVPGA